MQWKLVGEVRSLFVSQMSSPNTLLPAHHDEAGYKGSNFRQVRNHLGN